MSSDGPQQRHFPYFFWLLTNDSRRRSKFRFQRFVLLETTHAQDTEPDHAAFRVHTLHDSVVPGFLHVAGGLGELFLQVIRFRVEPDFPFVGHNSSPAYFPYFLFGFSRTSVTAVSRAEERLGLG